MTAKQPRSRGMARAERKEFFKLVTIYLAMLPKCRPSANLVLGEVAVDTPLGPLRLSVREAADSVCVFGRFEYPGVAAAVLGENEVNRHSGKWNFAYGKHWTGYEAYDNFRRNLNRVMAVRWTVGPPE